MTKTVTGAVADTARLCERVLAEVDQVIVGKRQAVTTVLLGVLASGHILIEDLPGLGKTLLARTFATVLGLEFTRVQFTPDMLPADLTGAMVLDLATGEPSFRPGPVFTGLLLADEINRTPPKPQAALLEAMAEGQVSLDGVTHPLPSQNISFLPGLRRASIAMDPRATREWVILQLTAFPFATGPRLSETIDVFQITRGSLRSAISSARALPSVEGCADAESPFVVTR